AVGAVIGRHLRPKCRSVTSDLQVRSCFFELFARVPRTPAEEERRPGQMTETADSRRWLALYVLCAGMLMIVLDATIVNVALPSIENSLDFSQSNLAWVVNAYLIPFGGLLLLAGRTGDLLGQRRIFLIGLAVFTSASLLCAASQSQAMLIGARFVQGIGG